MHTELNKKIPLLKCKNKEHVKERSQLMNDPLWRHNKYNMHQQVQNLKNRREHHTRDFFFLFLFHLIFNTYSQLNGLSSFARSRRTNEDDILDFLWSGVVALSLRGHRLLSRKTLLLLLRVVF